MIIVNFDKAKLIAHEKRREARAKEFEPFDSIIAKQIPGIDAQNAELKRQKIRDKYAEIQVKMDAATSLDELKALLP